jgi:hypothetical protein
LPLDTFAAFCPPTVSVKPPLDSDTGQPNELVAMSGSAVPFMV